MGNLKHIILFAVVTFFCSCNVIEKSSRHGFESGYYQMKSGKENDEKVYLDITNENAAVYPVTQNRLSNKATITIPLIAADSLCYYPFTFYKKSLDIDITTVLFKYRPAIYDLPAQMTTNFNAALYAGWRHDSYHIKSKVNPLGNCQYEIADRGYDFGLFAGPGTTVIGPFSTRNSITSEYDGMILQIGIAGFLESSIASFGISTGFDYLLSPDKNVWIYHKKLWIGFIVGIALN
jgi:hypothetical protein